MNVCFKFLALGFLLLNGQEWMKTIRLLDRQVKDKSLEYESIEIHLIKFNQLFYSRHCIYKNLSKNTLPSVHGFNYVFIFN